MSTNTGRAPARSTTFAVATHESGVVTTSSLRPVMLDRGGQLARGGRAEVIVDVEPVRRNPDRHHLGAEFVEYMRRDVVGRTVGAIDHQLQTF
jgi:hypothetical protein